MVYKKFSNFQNGSFKSIQFKWKTPQYRILVNSPLYKQNTYCQYFTVHTNITQNATLEKHNNLWVDIYLLFSGSIKIYSCIWMIAFNVKAN